MELKGKVLHVRGILVALWMNPINGIESDWVLREGLTERC